MTDDIVARLRQSHRVGCECFGCEAADEIERLRAERDLLRRELNERERTSFIEIAAICSATAWEIVRPSLDGFDSPSTAIRKTASCAVQFAKEISEQLEKESTP